MAFPSEEYSIIGVRNAALLRVVAGTPETLVEEDLLFVRAVNFEPQVQTVTFEGDDTKEDRDILNGLNITVEMDKFDLKSIATVYKKDKVTAGLPDGTDYRIYFGDSSELSVKTGLVADVDAKNEDTGDIEDLRIFVPIATLKVFQPRPLQYNTKSGTELRLSAARTTVDLLDDALPSVPASGIFYYYDRLTPA